MSSDPENVGSWRATWYIEVHAPGTGTGTAEGRTYDRGMAGMAIHKAVGRCEDVSQLLRIIYTTSARLGVVMNARK